MGNSTDVVFSSQAVPVAGVYTRQLEIYEETIRLDDVIARVFTGPEVNDALSHYSIRTDLSIS